MFRRQVLVCAALVLGWTGSACAEDAPPPRQVNLGTASSAGVYHQIGSALCRFVSVRAETHGVVCHAEESGGSPANIAGLRSGDIDLAIVQANLLYNAVHGIGAFLETGPQPGLRMVMRLYDESLTVVAHPNAGVASLIDLRGKRVSLGPEASGTRGDAIRILREAGISVADLGEVLALSPDEHNDALCDGRIDAYFFIIGHPNRNTRAAIEHCGARIVPIDAPIRAAVMRAGNQLSDTAIPGGLYPGHRDPIPTLGVTAVLVATADTPPDIVALVVRGVQDNLPDFRRLHPVLANFSDAHAFDAPVAPLHPGTLDRRVAPSAPAVPPEPERARVTILHFADVADVEPFAPSGDLARIAAVIAREKADRPNVIVVNGGNTLSPSAIASLDQGAHMVRMLNQMLVDVMLANVREFDFGPEAARRLTEMSFPLLGANVMDGGRRASGFQDGVVIAAGGFRIGFVGGVRADTADLSNPRRLSFAPLVPALRAAADALRSQGADLVLALCGEVAAECEAMLADGVVDVVLGGAGSAAADARSGVGRVLLRSGADGNVVAALDLQLVRTPRDVGAELMRDPFAQRLVNDAGPRRPRRPASWTAAVRLIDSRSFEPDQLIEVVTQIELLNASLSLDDTIATFSAAYSSSAAATQRGEGSIADLVADALRARADADVALIDAGMIRGDREYAPGSEISLRTVFAELPRADMLALVTMTGAALRAALEHGVAMLPAPTTRFPQVAGMSVRFDPARPAGQRVLAVEIAGRPLDPRRRYRVATTSFLARGGEGYATIAASPRVEPAGDPPAVRDVVSEYVRRLHDVPVPPAGRLRAGRR